MFGLRLISRILRGKNVIRNQSYGDSPDMVYDEFPGTDKKAPVVIFWHGGGWEKGDKSGYQYVGVYFQKLGCNAIVADYPKFPDQTFPGFIKDSRALLEVIRKKHPKSKIYLAGHSSGAHTALITAMKQRENPVDGVIALAAPNWFSVKNWPRWEKVFTDPYESKKQETYSYVENSPKSTKYLSFHGANDITVSPNGTVKLHEYMMSGGINSSYKIYEMINHYLILGVFIPGFLPSAKREIKKFLDV